MYHDSEVLYLCIRIGCPEQSFGVYTVALYSGDLAFWTGNSTASSKPYGFKVCLRYRVWSLRFRVRGLGFEISGLGCGVWGIAWVFFMTSVYCVQGPM